MSRQDTAKKAEQQAEQAAKTEKEKDCNAAEQPRAETPRDAQLKKLQEQLEQSAADLAKQKDLLLRTAAEYDNYRKHTEREKTMVYADTAADTIEKILPVCDNPKHALAQQGGAVENFRKGVEMVLTQLNGTLEKMGVTAISQQGEPLNPEVHNAVSHIEGENLGEDIVAEVLQKGHRIGDRVIRHAIVQVAN